MAQERCKPQIKTTWFTRVELLVRKAWLEAQQELRASLSDYDIACELDDINFLLGER